jgi:uncharacterized protein with GYD domain
VPKYLSMVKYTTEALNGVRRDGYAKRPEAMREFGASVGVRFESILYMMPGGEWDFIAIMDADSVDNLLAMGSFSSASGVVARACNYELFSPEQIDAAIAGSTPHYSPPGTQTDR